MMSLVSMMAAAAAATAQPVAPINQVINAAYAGFRAQTADKFAAVPAIPDAEGKPFKVVLRLQDGNGTGIFPNSGFYTYEDGRLQFLLSADINPRPFYESDETEVLYFSGVNTPGKSYVASNAYGTSARVSVENWRRSALGVVSIPGGESYPYSRKEAADRKRMGLLDTSGSAGKYYPYIVDVGGPEARQLVANVRVVIEGAMAKLPSGKLAECYRSSSGPKIDAPYDIAETACWVGARITRIAYVNTATGAVLKEFGSSSAN